jgi:hypothetical protein
MVSAVTPVWSETKKTVRLLTLPPCCSSIGIEQGSVPRREIVDNKPNTPIGPIR